MTAAVLHVGSRWADPGRLEVVKWLAVAAMVADHVNLLLLGGAVELLDVIGDAAFPAFCLAFGIGLASSSNPQRAGLRLLVPGFLAQFVWQHVDPGHGVNVLLVFAACSMAAELARTSSMLAGVHVGALCAAALLVPTEGGPFGVLLVAAGFLAARYAAPPVAAVAGVAWCVLAPTFGTLAGVVAALAWPAGWPRAPRVAGLLAWIYAGHLVALAALQALL
jgi:hypothetical protein